MLGQFGVSALGGKASIPAVFHGTLSLVDGHAAPAAPQTAGLDGLSSEFHADLEITFDLLRQLGFVPVDPDDPAHALYLHALATHEQAPPAGQGTAGPHEQSRFEPDTIKVAFHQDVPIPPELYLSFGLVPPDAPRAWQETGMRAGQAPAGRPPPVFLPSALDLPPAAWRGTADGLRGKQIPWAAKGPLLPSREDGGGLPLPEDFDALLDFMGNPQRYPKPAARVQEIAAQRTGQEALGPIRLGG